MEVSTHKSSAGIGMAAGMLVWRLADETYSEKMVGKQVYFYADHNEIVRPGLT